MNLDGN
jgi:hypothetical protein